eukprot:13056683-Alexandrium_andersonii.AAC.1
MSPNDGTNRELESAGRDRTRPPHEAAIIKKSEEEDEVREDQWEDPEQDLEASRKRQKAPEQAVA